MNLEKHKYPIGKFVKPTTITSGHIQEWIETIEKLPDELSQIVPNLSSDQLQTPYRPDGWTAEQVIHHLADSHMNAYIRCKLALTEEHPTIKPYFENRWAELKDGKQFPVMISLQLLTALHFRWVYLLRSLYETDFRKSFFHPESKRIILLEEVIGVYAWHGRHHTAHIKMCIK